MEDKMDNREFNIGATVKIDPYEAFKIKWLETHKNLRGCHLAYKKVQKAKSVVKKREKPFTDTPINNAEFTYLVG